MRASRIVRRLVLAAVLLAVPLAVVLGGPADPPKDFKGAESHNVVRVEAPNLVVLSAEGKQQAVRLIGVGHPSAPHTEPALRFLRNVLEGEAVYLELDRQQRDEQGRVLAYLYRAPDGLFVNLEMLRQGYVPLDALHLSKHKEVLGRWEKVAKEKRKGLWGATVVYVTETGHKYHRASCRYLRQSCEPITLEDARKRYGPCSVCRPPK